MSKNVWLLNNSIFELPAKFQRSIFERPIVAEGTDSNSLEFTKLQSLFLHVYLLVNLVISLLVLSRCITMENIRCSKNMILISKFYVVFFNTKHKSSELFDCWHQGAIIGKLLLKAQKSLAWAS